MATAVLRFMIASAITGAFAGVAGAQQAPDSLPPGVTAQMITQGASLFKGQGICAVCHGPEAMGIPNLGADLTDEEWIHGDGSYEATLETITKGVAPDKSTTGAAMPPKGGSSLNSDQLKAVAAYVWSLSQPN